MVWERLSVLYILYQCKYHPKYGVYVLLCMWVWYSWHLMFDPWQNFISNIPKTMNGFFKYFMNEFNFYFIVTPAFAHSVCLSVLFFLLCVNVDEFILHQLEHFRHQFNRRTELFECFDKLKCIWWQETVRYSWWKNCRMASSVDSLLHRKELILLLAYYISLFISIKLCSCWQIAKFFFSGKPLNVSTVFYIYKFYVCMSIFFFCSLISWFHSLHSPYKWTKMR